ncbi:transposable element Tc3 transposase [Trichonephila clavipes]|nr:transposable element Tc3 transposase [Trichonephila clavipes]
MHPTGKKQLSREGKVSCSRRVENTVRVAGRKLGTTVQTVMLAFASDALKLISQEKITNILKPGKDPTLPDSFRPISLLPVLSKITEKIIQKRLCQHLTDNDILIPQQHGFRAGLSTSHQLLRVVEYIKTGFRDRKSTGAVFLDIQKAFDRDHQARRRFVEWAQTEIAVVPDFQKRILLSDEAHFWLNGYVNKQNCRIWSEANPRVYVETPLHPEKLTVWCALWAGGIIGPYFFKNDKGRNVTVNGDWYRAMITNFFIPELNNHDVQELWFQQDGATCHTARATIDLLKDTFGDRLISHFGPVNWPPRSCDLTPLEYILWGYVKSLVYADKPQLPDHLEDNIRRVIADIRPQMLEKVIEKWTSRLDYIRASCGSHMPEIIFKM